MAEPPARPGFEVSLWLDRGVYYPGETVHIHFSLSREAYVYIVDHDTQGYTRLIFPNRYDPDNFLGPGSYTLPRAGETFQVEGPPGVESLQLIASPRPLRPFQVLFRARREGVVFPLIEEPGSFREEVQNELRVEPNNGGWATAAVSFRVAGPGSFPPPPYPDNQPPVASFTFWPERPRVGETVTFDATRSHDPDGHIVAYEWDLDTDGIYESLGPRVTWRYRMPGRYPVTLVVRDHAGGVNSRTYTVVVGPGRAEARLEIDSRPRGARIFVDGAFRGRTPQVLLLESGQHYLRLEAPGRHGAWETTLDLTGLDGLELRVVF